MDFRGFGGFKDFRGVALVGSGFRFEVWVVQGFEGFWVQGWTTYSGGLRWR